MDIIINSFHIISVILKEISRRGENESGKRNPVLMVIDEFRTYTIGGRTNE